VRGFPAASRATESSLRFDDTKLNVALTPGTDTSAAGAYSKPHLVEEVGLVSERLHADDVLALWRDLERLLAQAEPGSLEFDRLQADVEFMREEYQRIVRENTAELPSAASPDPSVTASA
jgi:hypothetical protein